MNNQIGTNRDTAIICGNHINAHTLVRSLMGLGWAGRLVLLRHEQEAPGFAACLNPEVESWAVDIKSPDELPGWIEARCGGDGAVYVFFTDERYHPAFFEWIQTHPDSSLRMHLGSLEHMTAILDRYEFCRFIETRNLASVPKTIKGEADPFAAFGESFVVRPRLSWFGVCQRERVRLVHGRGSYDAALASYASRGIKREDLSYQELLSIRNQDNVSICGWYGPSIQYLYCTRKVLQYPPNAGGGDVVELLTPPDSIMAQAIAILDAMAYDGPFELEFVFDKQAKEFKVIELNPRFWLQHGLIDAVSGAALVNTYLGRPPLPITDDAAALRYWVNPLYTCYRALQFDFRNLRHWMSRNSWVPFSLREGFLYAQNHVVRKLANYWNVDKRSI